MLAPARRPTGSAAVAELRRQWRLVVAFACLGFATGCGFIVFGPTNYTARAAVLVSPLPADPTSSTALTFRDVSMATERQILRSTSVVQRVPALLGRVARPVPLSSGLRVEALQDTQVLEIHYQAHSADQAATLANAFADAYLAYRADVGTAKNQEYVASLNRRVSDLVAAQAQLPASGKTPSADATRADLAQQIAALRQEAALLGGALVSPGQVVDRATAQAIRPDLPLRSVVGGGLLGGFLLGVLTSLVWTSRARGLHDLASLSELVGAPAWSAPHPARVAELAAQEGTARGGSTEEYAVLGVKLVARLAQDRFESLLIVDLDKAVSGAAMIASALGGAGRSVSYVVPSPEIRSAAAHEALEQVPALPVMADNRRGEVRSVEVNVNRMVQAVEQEIANQHSVEQDLVLVDGTELSLAQTLRVAMGVTGVLVTAERDSTSRERVIEMMKEFTDVGVVVVGAVLFYR